MCIRDRVTPMNHIVRDLVKCRSEKILTMSGFIADQTPPPDDNAFWTTFLNQDTGFYRGAEKVAIKYDMPVIFINIVKRKRGFYELESVSYTHLRAHETVLDLVCRLLLEKQKHTHTHR